MTRVLMVLSNGFTHDPRVSAEAASLVRAGFDITVLCWDRRGALPPEEVRGGVRVVRVRNALGMKLRAYDLFRLKAFWRLALRRALQLHAATPFDVIHCHDFDTLPVGTGFKERTRVPLVYDAHEIFPYLLQLSRARWWASSFEARERALVPRADLIIAAGPAHQDYLRPMTDAPILLVMNTKPLVWTTYEPPTTTRMTVVYFGGLDPTRFLLPLAELAVDDSSFDVVFGGDGPLAERIRALAARSHGNLRYLGLIPMDQVIPATRAADIVFSMADPSYGVARIGVPNKFFEALVAGRPVLVNKGMWVASEAEAADCGLAIDCTKDALRAALKTLQTDPGLRERMGRNAFRLAQEKYNWGREEAALLAAYRQLTG